MKHVTTVIIGAGHSGLAMSKRLADRSVDHVLLERGEVAHSWRTERWDSLRLLTPNWQSRLPGHAWQGEDQDGYMDMPSVVGFLDSYADAISAPVETHANVLRVRAGGDGFVIETSRGKWTSARLVLASGACNIPLVPPLAGQLPKDVASITPMEYRSPDQLDQGAVMVVGASASGVQLAREIQLSGRQVILCVGEHVRVPRMYCGRDIQWWMDRAGVLDMTWREVDDIERARRVPSLQLAGTPERTDFDLNSLANQGVRIVGRLAAMNEGKAMFSGALANKCALADLKMYRLLDTIDEWARDNGLDGIVPPPTRPAPTIVDPNTPLTMDLASEGVRTVLWATGYRPDYSWLELDAFDRKGRLRHEGGVCAWPGLYVLGLPYLRRRKSSLIDGAGPDSLDLAEHLVSSLHRAAA